MTSGRSAAWSGKITPEQEVIYQGIKSRIKSLEEFDAKQNVVGMSVDSASASLTRQAEIAELKRKIGIS
jgi:hypothetical protein